MLWMKVKGDPEEGEPSWVKEHLLDARESPAAVQFKKAGKGAH